MSSYVFTTSRSSPHISTSSTENTIDGTEIKELWKYGSELYRNRDTQIIR